MSDPNPAADPSTDHVVMVSSPTPRAAQFRLLPLVTGLAGVVLGVAIGSLAPNLIGLLGASSGDVFQRVLDGCGVNALGAELADNGKTLLVDGKGKSAGSGDVTFDELECIIDGTGAPQSVKSLMFATRSLDGRQSGSWDDIEASWSYHPDNGLDIIFEITRQ